MIANHLPQIPDTTEPQNAYRAPVCVTMELRECVAHAAREPLWWRG